MPRLPSIFNSTVGDWVRFGYAYWWLFKARRVMKRARGNEWLFAGEPPAEIPETTEDQRMLIKRRVAAVSRASRYPYRWALCLQRSLALRQWLAKDGIQTEVKYGVRRNDGKFEAHAWVVYDGMVLNDSRRHISTFAPLKSIDDFGKSSSDQIQQALVTSRTKSESAG